MKEKQLHSKLKQFIDDIKKGVDTEDNLINELEVFIENNYYKNKKRLKDNLQYIIWCLDQGFHVKECRSFYKYQLFLKSTKEGHCGSCVKEPAPCPKCILNDLEIETQNIYDTITKKKTTGHCGKECLYECEGCK